MSTTPSPVTGVDFVTIPTRDLAAARELYATVLGLEAARALLGSRGVSFHGDTMDTGVCCMAHFRDPDGNPLMLHHRYAPRAG